METTKDDLDVIVDIPEKNILTGEDFKKFNQKC